MTAALIALMLAAAAPPPPPNVVFVLADDLGVNDLGCYGRADHRTPHLDALAKAGTRFTAAYAACPVCSPTRAALMTGKSPARLHLTTFLPGRPDCPTQKLLHPTILQQLPLDEVTLAEHLKARGYATGCFGKWHLGGKGFMPKDQGFDEFDAGRPNTPPTATEGGKGEYALTATACDFLTRNRDRPFFLYLAHNNPHIPYAAKPALLARNAGAFEPTYAAVVETLDDAVGVLLAKLDELGLRGNTLVVFTSDNGGLHVPEGGHRTITHNTPCRAGKGFLYEGGIRVPCLVRWPGTVPAGRVAADPVVTTDWLPTLLELAGAPVPAGLDGASFAAVLRGGTRPPPRLHWHLPHYTNQGSRPGGAVRDGDWKYVEHYEDGAGELYDLAADPGEGSDLAARNPAKAAALRRGLADWRAAVGAQVNAPNPAFDPARHRELYVDTDPSKYDPVADGAAGVARMAEWRKRMNAAVPMKPAVRK